ncbi:double-CXXCG motif protein [Archangium gephyra]|uniref:SitI6 family double-CXXCG motif immunity protein n=1 Tax=Archangium gephyra TaxID=48 RepID=UPI0035D4AEBE
MRYFRVEADRAAGYTGDIDGTYKWLLPGIRGCPTCKATWSDISRAYPSVDLTPIAALADFEKPRPEPIEEYERLRELVRPFLPVGAIVEPGSSFGPFMGKGQGRFGPFAMPLSCWLLVQREPLEKLQAEGLLGLKGCRTQLRFRQRATPEFLDLEILPVGRAHPDCLPPERQPPCSRCGRLSLRLPEPLVLDAATLPSHLDVFRLEDFSTVIVCTQRFVDACQRLGLDGVSFRLLPTK